MIVFASDYGRYPGCIIDTTTRNHSFLKVCKFYQEAGVEHWFFPLVLLNPALQGVDPHSEDLTLEQKAMIIDEIDNNPWYYLREVVVDKGAGVTFEDICFKANRANIAAMWLLLANIDYIQIQPRQTGKSFGADVNTLWLVYFKYRDTQVNIITKDDTLRQSNVIRLRKLRDGWPDYLSRNTKKDAMNQQQMTCHMLRNVLNVHVGRSSDKDAEKLGRGLTSPHLQIDEGPFISHIETTVVAATGSLNTAREIARRKRFPFATIFTTTAGNRETRDGKYMYDIWASAAPWRESFFDVKDRDELINLIQTNSSGRSRTVNLTFDALQLGKSKEWLYEALLGARSSGDNVDRDYFNRWTSSSTDSLIPAHLSRIIQASVIDPINTWTSKDYYMFNLYEEIDPAIPYVLTVDMSDAAGRDDIGVTLVNSMTGATTGDASFNETNLHLVSRWILEVMLLYKNTILVIENRYNAQHVIDYLCLKLPTHGEDPFVRIFNHVVQNKQEKPKEYQEVSASGLNRSPYIYDKYKKSFGFHTDANLRKFLYSTVILSAAEDVGGRVYSKKLVGQVLSLEVRNNRVDHTADGHDDLVIAWLMAHWFLNHGKNLKHYNIDATQVMVSRQKQGRELTVEDQIEKRKQLQIKSQVNEIHEKLKETTHPFEIARLSIQLERLLYQLNDDDGGEIMTLDAILQSAEEARRSNGFQHTSKRNPAVLDRIAALGRS